MAYKDTITPVQFRIGDGLLDRINAAVEVTKTGRNEWISKAIDDLLSLEDPLPLAITSEEILSNKKTIMVRLPHHTVEHIDGLCEEKKIKRTV